MKLWWHAIAAFVMAGCAGLAGNPALAPQTVGGAPQAEPAPAALPEVELRNYGPAPELNSEVWLNVAQPLRLADLRGQVVLLDMWTFG